MRTTRLIFTKRFGKNNRSGTKWHHPLAHFSRLFSSSAAAAATTDDSFISTKCSPCLVHSSLSNGLLDYARGWAWQQTVLSQRLELRRQSPNNNDDADCVFLFHHHPVYTLGRGADESHLVFFQGECCLEEEKERLARSNRGVGSARLSVDARHHQVEINNNPRRMQSKPSSLREAVTLLSGTTSHLINYIYTCMPCYSDIILQNLQFVQSWHPMAFPFTESNEVEKSPFMDRDSLWYTLSLT